jgi:hypothetical protein
VASIDYQIEGTTTPADVFPIFLHYLHLSPKNKGQKRQIKGIKGSL